MKKIVLLGLLLLNNATLFSAQDGAAVDQQSHVPSLQSIAALSTLQMMKKNHPNIYNNPELFEEKLNENTALPNSIKNKLITLYKESKEYKQSKEITFEAARLWVEDNRNPWNYSDRSPLQRLKWESRCLLDDQGVPWNFNLQNIIDAGGADILIRNTRGILNRDCMYGSFGNLSLTSLKGFQNIPNIIKIKELNLSQNKLSTIHSNIDILKKLTQLQILNLSKNQLTEINPDTFKGLELLQSLNLSWNQLTTIHPNAFKGLKRLKRLHLNNNQLTEINPDVFNGLKRLKKLDLSWNKLKEINPDAFNRLKRLKELDLSWNQLTTIHPDRFKGLFKLQILYLGNNQFTTIYPDTTFKDLKQLQWLYLNNNKLITIDPDTFKGLKKLRFLCFYNTKLTQEQLALIRSQVPANCQIRE